MKLRRQSPPRPHGPAPGLGLGLLALAALLVLALLVAGWVKGGAQPVRPVEQPVPDSRLAR